MGNETKSAGDPLLGLQLQFLKEVELGTDNRHVGWQERNGLSLAVTSPSLFLVIRFWSLLADLSYSLQIGRAGGDDAIGLSEIQAEQEVNPSVLPAEAFEEGCKFRVADLVEMNQLLLIESNFRRPVFYERVGLCFGIKVITQQFDNRRLAGGLVSNHKDDYSARVCFLLLATCSHLPACLLPKHRLLDVPHLSDHIIFKPSADAGEAEVAKRKVKQLEAFRFVGYPIRIAQFYLLVLIQMGETLQQALGAHKDQQNSKDLQTQDSPHYERQEGTLVKERSGLQMCGQWLFQTRNTAVSASTAFIALSLLHRLAETSFSCSGRERLVCGVLLMISSKFNDVKQLRIKQLNRVLGSYLVEEYRSTEGEVLEALEYQVVQERNIFIRLAKLHAKQMGKVEQITKHAINQWSQVLDPPDQQHQAGATIPQTPQNHPSLQLQLREMQLEAQ